MIALVRRKQPLTLARMDTSTLLALVALAFGAAWTPGPNNMMLASSGANFGVRRTIPHIAGINVGFPLMMFAVALGLGEVFQASSLLREVLRWAGAALLLYFAWRIATAGRAGQQSGRSRPFTFVEAAGFQWVNPKAWVMTISTAAVFVTGSAPVLEAAICALVFMLVGITSTVGWTSLGALIRQFLSDDRRLRVFNIVMGLLVASYVVTFLSR